MDDENYSCGCSACRSTLGGLYVFWLLVLVALAAIVGLGGCALDQPLTPGQREVQARQRAAQGVLYCEVRGGDKVCSRIDRAEVGRILRGW